MHATDLRPARIEDAADIARVHVETWQATYAPFMPATYLAGLSVERHAAQHGETLRRPDPHGVFLVGTVGGEVRGFARAGRSRDGQRPDDGELYAIYVHPDTHGSGLGRMLMDGVRTRLRTAGFRRAHLWVVTGNERAEAFYRAAGWWHDGDTHLFRIPGADVPERRYVTTLDPQPER